MYTLNTSEQIRHSEPGTRITSTQIKSVVLFSENPLYPWLEAGTTRGHERKRLLANRIVNLLCSGCRRRLEGAVNVGTSLRC